MKPFLFKKSYYVIFVIIFGLRDAFQMNTYSTSKLFTHKPVINYIAGTTDQKYEPVLTVHEDRVFYFGNNNLLSLNYDSKDWKSEAPPPFKVDYGFTMTSTPAGLVIFGGCTISGSIISDTWIYSFDRWRALTHNASPRCFHTSTWIPALDALLISGGYNNEGFLSDFLLLDLKSGYTREFPLQYPLSFAYHTVTVITDNMLCLYGGKCSDGSQNNKTFLININDGSVREINVVPFFEPRYLHRAFNFFGNLLVTGGYSEMNSFYLMNSSGINRQRTTGNQGPNSNACIPILFVFLHRVWLTFYLPDSLLSLIHDIGYILPLNKGLMFISSNGGESAVLFFNESHEPFGGTKDTRYITFLNNLLYQNLNSLNLDPENSPVEARRKALLEERRKIYDDISNKLGVEDLSYLVNERDLLNRLLPKVRSNLPSSPSTPEIIEEVTSKPTRKRSKSTAIHLPSMTKISQPDEFNYSNLMQDALNNLNQLNTIKQQHKESLSKATKTVESLFQEVQQLMSQKGLSSFSPPRSSIGQNDQLAAIVQKASLKNLSVIKSEIDRAKFQFKSIVEQLNIYNKMKIDSSKNIIHVYEKIDSLLTERHKKKQKLVELQKKYLKNTEEILSKMLEISKLSSDMKNDKIEKLKETEKSILFCYDKLKSIKIDHRIFVAQLNDQIAQFRTKAEKLQLVSNIQSKEQLLTQAIQTAEALSAISNTFNEFSKQVTSPSDKIFLQSPRHEKKDLPDNYHNLTIAMRHGRRPSFQSDPQGIQDGVWKSFYEIVDSVFANVDSISNK